MDQESSIENFFLEEFLAIHTKISNENLGNYISNWTEFILTYFKENPNNFLEGDDAFYLELEQYWKQKGAEYTRSVSG